MKGFEILYHMMINLNLLLTHTYPEI